MLEDLLKELENKKIVILGFGREGKSTYNFIRKHFFEKEIDVIDENININSEENTEYIEDMNLNIIKTSDYLEMLENYDYIFKTPGISFKGKDISKIESKITSELDMFLIYYKKYVNIIGITGTKGKSTTSSLIYEILKNCDRTVHFLGNIGVPLFNDIDTIKKGDYVVLEISSHQSQYIKNSPNIGVVLNVFEEHLDHYNSYDEYIDAKINVIKYQDEEDYAIIPMISSDLYRRLENIKLKSNVIKVDLNSKNKFDFYDFDRKINLIGEHNVYNILICLTIAGILKLDNKKVVNAIYNFKPLEHRLELVGKYNGITYYNDSISTIPEATISCIKALKSVNTLIIGGMDRGINYSLFEDYLASCNIENIICMYETGKKIYDKIKVKIPNERKMYLVSDLNEAVKIAKEVTKKGGICAMSPAAASYGHFKNFEERGKLFKEYIKN